MAGNPFYKSPQWKAVRLKALKRDRWRCRFCGKRINVKGQPYVDHIVPRRKAPHLALTLSNLQSLCSHCHNAVKQRQEANPDAGCNAQGYTEGWS